MAQDISHLGARPVESASEAQDISHLGARPLAAQQEAPVQTQAQAAPAQSAAEPSAAGIIPAVGKGVVRGLGDAGLEFGNLAGDILSRFEMTKSAGKKLMKMTDTPIEPSQVELDHPVASSIAAGTGYTAGMMGGPSKFVRGAEELARPVLGGISKLLHPAVSGAVREGTIGALQGAAMQPDNRGIGGAVGGAIGAPLGALGGIVGKSVQTGAQMLAPELQRMKGLGFDVSSPEAVARARQELASRGEGALKDSIQSNITKQAEAEVNAIKPNSANIPDKSPNQIIVDKQATQFAKVLQAKKDAYAPLDNAELPIEITHPKVSAKVNDYLPESPLQPGAKGKATFSQLQSYRQDLDLNVKSARMNLTPKQFKEFLNVRNTVTQGMKDVADTNGLSNEFANAENIYRTQYLPFRTFSKTGKIATPEESDVAWKEINSLMGQKNPDPKKLKNLVSTLGDEGKDVVGWALLQNAATAAKSGNEINLSSFNNTVNKFKVSGLDSIFAKPEYKQAIVGINRIIQDGKKASDIKTNRLYIPFISPIVEHLMQTGKGIKLIVKLGSANKSSKAYREAIQSLFTGAVNIPAQKVMQAPKDQGNIPDVNVIPGNDNAN